MKDLARQLMFQKEYLLEIQKQVNKSLIRAPKDGRLRVAYRKGKPQYYYMNKKNDTKGEYIQKKDISKAKRLAQRDYDKEVIGYIKKRINAIEKCIKCIESFDISELHRKSPGRELLINPYEVSKTDYIHNWQNVQYEGKQLSDTNTVLITNNGERVRSKSEKIIADKFFELNVPYRYEYPRWINGWGNIYPDFTLLDANNRREIIYEHFGRMDDPEYAEKTIVKINKYINEGLIVGKDFIFTMETSKMPLDIRNLEIILRDAGIV